MASPVSARIAVAQVDWTPPGGYVAGSVDGLALAKAITCTNVDNTGVQYWRWEIFPAVGLEEATYSASGKESAALTLTPPSPAGYGDLAIRLTVIGEPLSGGRPNVATDQVLLGVRAPTGGYPDGVPLPHPQEASIGAAGRSIDPTRGYQGRATEALRALLGLTGGGAGGAIASTVLCCTDGSVSGASVYTTFADAYTAAALIKGQVRIQLLGTTASIASGTYNMANRIAVVGVPTTGTKVAVTMADGAVFTNMVKAENVAITTAATSGSAISVAGNTVLDLSNTSITTAGAGNAVSLADQSQVYMNKGSAVLAGTAKAFKITGTASTEIVVEDTSSIADEQVDDAVGTTVAITATSTEASVGTQSTATGTITQTSALEPWIFRLDGPFSDPDTLPADIDGLRLAEVACRAIKVTAFRGDKGAGASSTVDAFRVNVSGSTSILNSAVSIATTDGDNFTATSTDFDDPTFAAGDRCTVRLTAVEDTEDSPEGPADLYVRIDRVKA